MPSAGSRSLARAAATALALALAVHVGPAAAAGLPLPVEDSPSGILAPGGASRYLTVTLGGRTAVLAQQAAGGAITGRLVLLGRFGVPLVAYDSTPGGVSGDGRTLVLIRPRTSFPRANTTLAVISLRPKLRLRRIVRLPGDFSYDALSPDGRSLYLVNYLSGTDPTKYRVRVFDLARNRLEPKPVVDPREPPDAMNGLPVTRASSPDGRWAYTLYDGAGKHPFIHALDTRDRKAFCIDLDGAAFAGANAYELRLALADSGRRIDIRAKGALVASVDTKTFRVRDSAAARPVAASRAADGRPGLLWPLLGAGLLGIALLLGLRRRSARGRRDAPPAEELTFAVRETS